MVWQLLNALRAHDDRFNAKINSLALNEGDVAELAIEIDHVAPPATTIENKLTEADQKNPAAEDDPSELVQQLALYSQDQWQEALYTRLVDKVGTRTYWEDWADDAISMLSQHLITAPVFNALFDNYDFIAHNPVAQVMDTMVTALHRTHIDSETDQLEKFYESVRVRASEVTSASGKLHVIKELYERFFRKASRSRPKPWALSTPRWRSWTSSCVPRMKRRVFTSARGLRMKACASSTRSLVPPRLASRSCNPG
ncbi:hypothetical protein CUTER_08680 [Corynebacterium uterequi]|uniref:Type ISP restriction-modification enzyme coupler domain-containing protein n=1 Tax=Corynebacterium uterequi TaxID=1072256 RepID=A0A0G3HKU2_9CORY|nr:hypothetical protein CUTER_08680 [Corynebacterium uterequi]